MTTDIKLDNTHDLVISGQDIVLFENLEEITVQRVKINLLNRRGEWFPDVNTGVPYLKSILGRRGTKDFADTVIKNTINATDNISMITSYQSTIDNERKLQVTFSAIMDSGGDIVNIVLEV
tara:strand:+ start:3569 stop:3931 length:363 start_codon:yes stop_codon:yes gene_type:complete